MIPVNINAGITVIPKAIANENEERERYCRTGNLHQLFSVQMGAVMRAMMKNTVHALSSSVSNMGMAVRPAVAVKAADRIATLAREEHAVLANSCPGFVERHDTCRR